MTTDTATQILAGEWGGSWNEFISSCSVADLQAMARLWLLKDGLETSIDAVIDSWANRNRADMIELLEDLNDKLRVMQGLEDIEETK